MECEHSSLRDLHEKYKDWSAMLLCACGDCGMMVDLRNMNTQHPIGKWTSDISSYKSCPFQPHGKYECTECTSTCKLLKGEYCALEGLETLASIAQSLFNIAGNIERIKMEMMAK